MIFSPSDLRLSRWDGNNYIFAENVRHPVLTSLLSTLLPRCLPGWFSCPFPSSSPCYLLSLLASSLPPQDQPELPEDAIFTEEEDCRICESWIHATVAWLPFDWNALDLDVALHRSCNDTWIIHRAAMALEKTGIDTSEQATSHKTWNHRYRCEEMLQHDKAQEALWSMWTLWDTLQPLGGLPQAVCCRLDYCPCPDFGSEALNTFWTGPEGNEPPV